MLALVAVFVVRLRKSRDGCVDPSPCWPHQMLAVTTVNQTLSCIRVCISEKRWLTVADSDMVNIRQLILILTMTLGVLEPMHLLSRHAQ